MALKDIDENNRNESREPSSPSSTQNNTFDYQPPVVYRNAREYAQALRPWLWQYQNCVMHSMAANFAMQMQASALAFVTSTANSNYYSPLHNTYLRQRVDSNGGRMPHSRVLQTESLPHTQPQQHQQFQEQQTNVPELQGTVLKIPTFWKRVAAELIDFTFLFYIKMIVSLFLVTELSLDHISLISSDDIFETFSELDYDRAFAITFEVIALEVINRVLITIFETLCLYRPLGARGVIGATPGKRLMGLKVVSCDSVQGLGHGQVLVSPAGNITLKNAFLRSVIKNFTIAFFLPACLTLFFFSHNRTAYDIVAHTIVVEDV